MAALLVGMAVMAVLLSVAMPTWNQMVRREKEEELVFRGNQYARALNLYQRKFANASPANLDVLVEQRMLRKKFKDPMSTEKSGEFQLLYLSNSAPSGREGNAGQQRQGGAGQGNSGRGNTGQQGNTGQAGSVGAVLSTTPNGLIAGVTSTNKSESIRILDGKKHYNEWQFVGMQQSAQAGAGAGGTGIPGMGGPGAGRQGTGRGGRSVTTPDGSTTFTTRGGATVTPPGGQQGGRRGANPPPR
ncbi:MAG: type II secretion system GspH family protein [Vicinamibacterales bacterium]|nr:type II secretion system GspH family protein [Vicinamibacterales bacterium]